MAVIGMRELLRDPRKVFSTVEESKEPVLVTNRGRPVAALYPVDASQAEELMLESAPDYVESRRRAEHARAEGRTSTLAEAIAEYNAEVEPDERIESNETDHEPAQGASATASVAPEIPYGAELQTIFGAELGREVAEEARRRVAAISEALIKSAVAGDLLSSAAGIGGQFEDRQAVEAHVAELSANLLSEVMREILLDAAWERVSALDTENPEPTPDPDPEGIFGRRLAEETLDTATACVEQFTGQILSLAPHYGPGGLVPAYDAWIKTAGVFGFGRATRFGAAPARRGRYVQLRQARQR